jgi:hydrogenase maturation protein HypF
MKTILALGADVKNTYLFAEGRKLSFGPYIGDLRIASNYEKFKKGITGKLNSRKERPHYIAYDLHPGYFSTRFAVSYKSTSKEYMKIPVQHHHAHIASVLYEHGLKKPVIGVSFDGTGFGTDGNIWGGEFLLVHKNQFTRRAHFKYVKMPGSEAVVKEPWRMGLSVVGNRALPYLKKIPQDEKALVQSMIKRDINSPKSSSVGRLFDAAAALLGICHYTSMEAEGPIRLEKFCDVITDDYYEFKFRNEQGMYIIDSTSVFLQMIDDLQKQKNISLIATKFHNAFTEIIVRMVRILSKEHNIKDIVLSGGVFQNNYLLSRSIRKLTNASYSVYTNKKLPVNDLNIALGQYYVSCYTSKS